MIYINNTSKRILNSLLAKQFHTLNEQSAPIDAIDKGGGWTQDVEPMDTTKIDDQNKKAIWDKRTSEMKIVSLPVKPYFGIVGQMGDTADFVTPSMGAASPNPTAKGGPDNRSPVEPNRLMGNLPKTVAGKPYAASQVVANPANPAKPGESGTRKWHVPAGAATHTLSMQNVPSFPGMPSIPIPIITKGKTVKPEIIDRGSDVGENDPSQPGQRRRFDFLHQNTWQWYNGPTLGSFDITSGITEDLIIRRSKKYMTDNYKSKLLEKYQILKEQQGGDQYVSNEFGDVTTRNQQLRNAGIDPIRHAQDQARVAQTNGVRTAIAAGYQDGIEPGRDRIEAQQAELKKQQKIATQPIDDRQRSWDKLEDGAIKSDAEGDTLVGNTGKTRRQFEKERDEAIRLAKRSAKYDLETGELKVPLRTAPGPNASQEEQNNYQRYLLAQQRQANQNLVSWAKEAANKKFLEDNPDFAQMETQKEDDRRKQDRQDWLARNSARRDARQQQRDRIVKPFDDEHDRLEVQWFEAPARDATRQKPEDPDFVGPPRYFHNDGDGGVQAADGSDPPPVTLGKGESMVDVRYRKFGRHLQGPDANAPDNAYTTYDPTVNAQGKLIRPGGQSFLKFVSPKSRLSNPFNLPSFTPKGIVSNRRSNPNNTPYSPRRETLMASMDYFSQKLKNKYNLIREEIVNPKNAGTMSKGEIASRDRLATKVKAKPIKGKDTEKNAKYRLATFITLRNRKGN